MAHSQSYTITLIIAVLGLAAVSGVFYFGNGCPKKALTNAFNTDVDSAIYDLFQTWSQKTGRSYGSEDERNYRLLIFRDNYLKIKANVESNKSFTLAINQFSDMTNEEFKAKYLGLKVPQVNSLKSNQVRLSTVGLPDSVDWRSKGAVAAVKDQGQCGSCWAFSTIAAVEGLHATTQGSIATYSEQQLVDCSKTQGNEGCNGGWMDWGFEYIKTNGIESEDDYKYVAKDQKCKAVASKSLFKIASYVDVPANDNDQLKAAVAQGVVSVAIEADTEVFQFYSKGVITGDSCGTTLDHGVAVVGYDTLNGQDFWLVRNSWGASWGDQGYVRIARQSGSSVGVCGITQKASYPTA